MIPSNNDGDFGGVSKERESRVFSSPSWCLIRTIYESELITLKVGQATWEVFLFLPGIIWALASHLFQLRQFKAFQVMALNMCFIWGAFTTKNLFALLTSTECVGVLPIYLYTFLIRNGSRNVSQTLGIPKKDPAGMWAWIIMSHQAFHTGNFWKHPRIKTENRESRRGHVEWWDDTKQMFGLMQDVSVWDGIPNRIFPVLRDFDRYCSVMSSSNIAKYDLLELSCFDIFEQTSCQAMSPSMFRAVCNHGLRPPEIHLYQFWWRDNILHQLVCSNMVKHQKHHNNL